MERHIQQARQQVPEREFLSYRSTAEAADCSVSTIKRLVKSGRLTPVYLTPDAPRIRVAELEKLAGGGA